MPVELRKRKAPASAPPPPPAKKKASSTGTKSTASTGAKGKKDAAPKESEPPASNPTDDAKGGIPEGAGGVSVAAGINSATDAKATAAKAKANNSVAKDTKPKVGDTIELDGFGGEVETNDGKKVTLKQLVDESKAGVVLFTYPKASTPGCTQQVCLFRDAYEPLTATGLSIYGLSTDSPKANTTFKTKQELSYTLLCDPAATLIGAIGLKKSPKGTTRGVFVVTKDGKVLAAEPGGPKPTVDAVRKVVEEMG